VPEAFRAQIDLASHQKAADYTVASARIGRWDTLLDAAIALVLTLGGGLSAIDHAWQAAHLPAVWHGTAVVLSTFLLVSLSRPAAFDLAHVRRRGALRLQPHDGRPVHRRSVQRSAARLVLGGPLVFVILFLMQRAGTLWWLYAWFVWVGFTVLITWAYPSFIAPLVQQVHAAERRSAQAAHRSLAAALRASPRAASS
jgi:STE24 endopeptidase